MTSTNGNGTCTDSPPVDLVSWDKMVETSPENIKTQLYKFGRRNTVVFNSTPLASPALQLHNGMLPITVPKEVAEQLNQSIVNSYQNAIDNGYTDGQLLLIKTNLASSTRLTYTHVEFNGYSSYKKTHQNHDAVEQRKHTTVLRVAELEVIKAELGGFTAAYEQIKEAVTLASGGEVVDLLDMHILKQSR